MSFIPYGRQSIDRADIEAVVDVLQSDFLTQGPLVPRFEHAIANRCQAPHAVACTSGTAALHLACLALDIGAGDRVWTSAVSFVASANCARYCGARVDFIDVDAASGLMDLDQLEEKLIVAKRSATLPRAVIPVHLAGLPCDMTRIRELSERYGFAVIEDASHAIGATINGTPVGDGRLSDMCVFSFHPVKLITTGEGGMITTADARLAKRLERLRSHGITRDPDEMSEPSHGPWYYQQLELGFNYRLTDIQAALGLSQLDRLDHFIERRQQLADAYDETLAGLPLATPPRHAGYRSAWHLYVVRLDEPATHRAVFERLREHDIGVNLHYIPIPMQPYYRQLGAEPGDFPGALDYYSRAISLPLHPQLSQTEQEYVVQSLSGALA